MGIFVSDSDYGSIDDVRDEYPAAVEIVEVEGGWMVFNSAAEAETWRNQQ